MPVAVENFTKGSPYREVKTAEPAAPGYLNTAWCISSLVNSGGSFNKTSLGALLNNSPFTSTFIETPSIVLTTLNLN